MYITKPFKGHFSLFINGKHMKNNQSIGRKSTYFSKKCIISLTSINNPKFLMSKSEFSHPKTCNKHVI